jgi:hypothetical protein
MTLFLGGFHIAFEFAFAFAFESTVFTWPYIEGPDLHALGCSSRDDAFLSKFARMILTDTTLILSRSCTHVFIPCSHVAHVASLLSSSLTGTAHRRRHS